MDATFVPFSAYTRMSGVDMPGRRVRKGAAESIRKFVEEQGGRLPSEVQTTVERIAREGARPWSSRTADASWGPSRSTTS